MTPYAFLVVGCEHDTCYKLRVKGFPTNLKCVDGAVRRVEVSTGFDFLLVVLFRGFYGAVCCFFIKEDVGFV